MPGTSAGDSGGGKAGLPRASTAAGLGPQEVPCALPSALGATVLTGSLPSSCGTPFPNPHQELLGRIINEEEQEELGGFQLLTDDEAFASEEV